MRRRTAVAVAIVVAVVTSTGGYAVEAASDATGGGPLGPGLVTVEVDINHSRFLTDRIEVRRGTLVRFVVRNDDPINHELIVGTEAVHKRHEGGSESFHPPVPGEVSLAPDETGVTAYEFDRPGRMLFACHLPGHLAYGMKGDVVVS
jgi:uncharacterized cupredoxin-like copper-binding protein